jgi:CHAT domain-containing protein
VARARGALALAAIGVAAVMCGRHAPPPSPSKLEQLLRAAPAASRSVACRVAGLSWAPPAAKRVGGGRVSAEELEFEGLAGEILRRGERAPSPDELHDAGVASLLLQRPGDAIVQLQRAARRAPLDARIWNDLAAAQCAAAPKDPSRLPGALAAVDRAIQLAPALHEARFNRAAILTRLGLRNEAARAWRETMGAEGEPSWRAEARRRLAKVAVKPIPPLAAELEPVLARARAGDRAALDDLVRRRIEDVRASGETILVSAWAGAFAAGNAPAAARLMSDLRLVSAAIAATNGDRFMEDVVAAIDAATARRRMGLAKAHMEYRDARLHYRDQREGSDVELREVADRFDRLRSPMRHVARYYAANAMFDRTRVDDARVMLDRVLRDIDARRYPSLAAGVQKQLGLCYGFRGMWTAALPYLERSREIFAGAGESVNAAFTGAIIGEAYDLIGQFNQGWRQRSAALQVLSGFPPDQRSVSVLVGAVHAEIMRGDYEAALSLLAVTRQEAGVVGDPILSAEMLVREVRVLLRARSGGAARGALAAAKALTAKIGDPRARMRVEADIRVAEAEIVRPADPREAVAVITPAIKFYEANNFGILLPAAYLERGRAHLAAGDPVKALDDFTKGLAEIERQRANVATSIRTTMFDTIPDLIAETVDLLLAGGKVTEAYAVVERARARTLIESLGVPPQAPKTAGIDAIAASLPPGAVLIEYALLPHGVAAFCIRRGGMRVIRLPVDRAVLQRRIDELGTSIDARRPVGDVQQLSAALYEDLFAPLESELGGAEAVYIVPDRFLYATPFSALFDARRRQYLIERHRVVISPSGTFLLRRSGRARSMRPALIISDPSAMSGPRLPAARREAAAIARFYPGSILIQGTEATIRRFVAAAKRSALIHYAGHAGIDDAGGGFLLLAPSPRDDGRLDAAAISRLRLNGTTLVILSACATMRGSTAHVEGMPSISRGFLTAGAPGVLGMLWEIDDESAASLLLAFHQHLSGRHLPSAALRDAQCALLHDGSESLRHPASWAAAEFLGVD